MATPNELYGWFPGNQMQLPAGDRWMTIPERSNAGLLGFSGGPMTQLAYELAGSPSMKPGAGDILPYTDYPSDSGSSGAGDVLGTLGGIALSNPGLIKDAAGYIGGLLGGGSAASGAAGAAGIAGGMSAADSAAYAAMLNGGSPSAVFGGGAGLGGYSGALGGAEAAGGAALAGESAAPAGAAAAEGAGGALGFLGTPLGAASVVGLGAIAFDAMAAGSKADENRNDAAFREAFPGTERLTIGEAGGRGANMMRAYVRLPDGRLVDNDTYQKLAGAWYGATYAPDGNQQQWQQEYQNLLANLPEATLPKGYVYRDGKIVKG